MTWTQSRHWVSQDEAIQILIAQRDELLEALRLIAEAEPKELADYADTDCREIARAAIEKVK